jgi:hypothetical protein
MVAPCLVEVASSLRDEAKKFQINWAMMQFQTIAE